MTYDFTQDDFWAPVPKAERADFWHERADFRLERVDFRPERADFRPERA